MFAALGSALAVSRDGGATFENVLPCGPGSTKRVNHVAVSASPTGAPSPAIVYALGDSTMFVSLDGGMNWIWDDGATIPPEAGGIPPNVGGAVGTANFVAPSVLVVSPRSPFEVFLIGNDAQLWRGDYSEFVNTHRSTWEAVVPPNLGDQDSGNVFVAATQPGHGNVLFVSPHRSKMYVGPLDPVSASDWHALDQGDNVHADLHGVLLSPDFAATFEGGAYQVSAGTVWLLSDGGIYRSTDGGKYFHAAQNVKTLSCVNVAGVSIAGVGTALSLNTGDNDGFYSVDGGAHWTSQQYGGGDNDCSYADPLRAHSMLVFTPRWDTDGNSVSAAQGGTVTVYEAKPGLLPDARINTTQAHIVPGPPSATGPRSWNASSFFGLRGFRPIVLNMLDDDPAAPGDYVFIRFVTDTRAVLLRTQSMLEIDSRDDWDTLATTPFEGQRVYQQGPVLPRADLGVVQASGGHARTVFYVGGNPANELWKWTEGMTYWERIVPGGNASAARRFFVDPYRSNLIYLLDESDVKRSDDGGKSWHQDGYLQLQLTAGGKIPIARDTSSGEGDDFVEEVLTDMQFDPYRPLTRFAVGEGGAFFTNDGIIWNRLLDTRALAGRPTNCYYDWVSNPCERALYVALSGRSLLKISPLPWGALQAPNPDTWSTNVKVDGHQSKSTPALALFQGVMHMVHNDGGSNRLIWTTSTDGLNWSPSQTISGQKSKAGASIAEFGGLLHMVHLGDSSNQIWWSTNDGSGWTDNVPITGQLSQTVPALAALNGKLFMVHTGDSSNQIWVSTFDGNSWTKNTVINGQLSKSPVKLAVFSNKIHMVHLGDNSNHIWWSVFDDSGWWSNTRIRCQLSQSAPALATHKGLLHMIHRGDASNSMWWSLYQRDEWTPNVKIPNQLSKATAALCETPDRAHLIMLHLGDSSDQIWFSML
ncbi:MAG TPA: hypothetical protein VFB54_10685 [Burkholderiales bacterium]|nr:hypothetical protein [Burkholderiales bacterium]